MINVNMIINSILKTLNGVKVECQQPEEFNDLPIVSHYEIGSPMGFCADNAEWAQKSYVAIDVWARSVGECGEIAVEVDALMQKEGWKREMSRDMPPDNGVRHKSMRFYKQIFFENKEE